MHVNHYSLCRVKHHYDTLKPLMSADPMLLPLLIYICPRMQLPLVFHQIPVCVSAAWVLYLVSRKYGFDKLVSFVEISTEPPIRDFEFCNFGLSVRNKFFLQIRDIFDLTNVVLNCQKNTGTQQRYACIHVQMYMYVLRYMQ